MDHKTNLYTLMLGISAATLALANNAVAEGDKTNAENKSTTLSANEQQDDAALQFASSPKVTGPKNVPDFSDEDLGLRKKEVPFKPFALTLNALNLLAVRASVNFEVLPAVHHSIILNPSIMYWPSSGSSQWSLTVARVELGYRFYSGKKGANGFFIGPSFLFNYSSRTDYEEYYRDGSDSFSVDTESTDAVGVAIDLGGQYVSDNGFTIGGGIGVEYCNAKGFSGHKWSITCLGPWPRFLFMIGYSF